MYEANSLQGLGGKDDLSNSGNEWSLKDSRQNKLLHKHCVLVKLILRRISVILILLYIYTGIEQLSN